MLVARAGQRPDSIPISQLAVGDNRHSRNSFQLPKSQELLGLMFFTGEKIIDRQQKCLNLQETQQKAQAQGKCSPAPDSAETQ